MEKQIHSIVILHPVFVTTEYWRMCSLGWGREDCEFGISMCKLVYIGWVNNKVLMHSRRNYIQYPIINFVMGKDCENQCMYV